VHATTEAQQQSVNPQTLHVKGFAAQIVETHTTVLSRKMQAVIRGSQGSAIGEFGEIKAGADVRSH
jgi:hypothetical protein